MNRLVLLLTAIVLVGIAGFALVWFGVGRELQPLTAKILVDLRDGKGEAVHARADASLQQRLSARELQAYWDWWVGEMGAFVEILGKRGVGSVRRDGRVYRTLTVELGFMKGRMQGVFEYADARPDPLLAHLRLGRLDEGLAPPGDRSGLQRTVRRLLERYDAQDWMGLYAGLATELQIAWPPAVIAAELRPLHGKMGKATSLALRQTGDGTAAPGDDGGERDDVVVQLYDVTFERGRGEARITHRRVAGRWRVEGFVLR